MRIRKVGAALLAGWLMALLLPTATAVGTDALVSLSSSPVTGYVGERITVTLSVDQAENLSIANGQMMLSYDTAKLRYVSCRAGAALAGCMLADHESADGVRVGFLTVDDIAAQGEALLFTFEVLTDAPDTNTTLSLHMEEWVDGRTERNYAAQVAMQLGTLTLNPTVAVTLASGRAPIGGTTVLALSAAGTVPPRAAKLSVTLSYDAAKLQLTGVQNADTGTCALAQPVQQGRAQVTWTADAAGRAEGALMQLIFRVQDGAAPNENLPIGVTVVWKDTDGTDRSAWITVEPGAIAAQEREDGLRGDVNDDGRVSVTDVRLALRAAVGKVTLSEAQSIAADVNGDGRVSVSDVRQILRVAVGKV